MSGFNPGMMQEMMGGMVGKAIEQAIGAAKKMQISWKVKEFATVDELKNFVDGRRLYQAQLTTLGDKLILMYGVQS